MAQHLNTNQLHPAMGINQIPMLSAAGLNLTIMSTGQQHGIPQFTQGQPGMYQIVQQAAPGQLQMQNVVHQQHQLNNIHHQQLQQTSYQQPQITHQQVQQLNNHHQLNNHAQIQLQQNQQIQQQIQHQSSGHQDNSTNNQNTANTNNSSNNSSNNQQTTKQTQSSKKKKPKINKDGVPAPKRATTAYINFTQWYRESIKKTGRAVPKIGEFGKECAAKWNSMNDEEKKPFTEVAARDRDRYRREMEIYKPARDANKPKRPGTAFMLFMVDFRKEVAGKEPEGGVAALAKLGGERWRSMTDEDKKPYVEQQNECKIRYEKLMEEYRQKNGQLPNKKEGNQEESSEINSVADSENSEQQNNGDLKQSHSPGSQASPTQNQSSNDQQLEGLQQMNMTDFVSNDDNQSFNQGFNQQTNLNSTESSLYQQQHEQLEQTHEQQDSSQQFSQQNYNYQWN